MKRLACAAILIGLCSAGMLSAQKPSSLSLLALSKQDQTLSIVDPVTLRVMAKVPVGNDPHEVIASSDGRTAYVSNYGFGKYHTLAVADLVHEKAEPSIDVLPLGGPHGLAFADGKVWFTSEVAKAIGRYDPATRRIDWVLGNGQNRTHMLYVSPDLQLIVATNTVSGTVSVIDKEPMHMPAPGGRGNPAGMRTDWDVTNIKVGNGSEGFDVSPDRREVWVANAQDATISVIDLATKKVAATLQTHTKEANRLRFTPDGRACPGVKRTGTRGAGRGHSASGQTDSNRTWVRRRAHSAGWEARLRRLQPGQLHCDDRPGNVESHRAPERGRQSGRNGLGRAAIRRSADASRMPVASVMALRVVHWACMLAHERVCVHNR